MGEWKEKEKKFVMQTYKRFDLLIVKGQGEWVWDESGNKYLDCTAGIAVNNIGHCHPKLVLALKEQAEKLIHCSNWFYNELQIELAEKMSQITKLEKSFFCNSGAEAIEGAMKLARKHTGKKEIISMKGAFHGRTMGALAATWKENYKKPYKPLVPSIKHAEYGSIEKVKKEVSENTAAIIVEPIQGESGIIIPPEGFLKEVRELCDEKGILMIVDEIQTGFGRTGKMFAYEYEGIKPDILCLAKAIAGGLPMGAVIAREEIGSAFGYGDHGTTFGGSPFICAGALATLKIIEEEKLVEKSMSKGKKLKGMLEGLENVEKKKWEVRAKGLLIGVDLGKKEARIFCEKMLKENKVLALPTAEQTVRLVPPLMIDEGNFGMIVKAFE